jgi:hypothetical protein
MRNVQHGRLVLLGALFVLLVCCIAFFSVSHLKISLLSYTRICTIHRNGYTWHNWASSLSKLGDVIVTPLKSGTFSPLAEGKMTE